MTKRGQTVVCVTASLPHRCIHPHTRCTDLNWTTQYSQTNPDYSWPMTCQNICQCVAIRDRLRSQRSLAVSGTIHKRDSAYISLLLFAFWQNTDKRKGEPKQNARFNTVGKYFAKCQAFSELSPESDSSGPKLHQTVAVILLRSRPYAKYCFHVKSRSLSLSLGLSFSVSQTDTYVLVRGGHTAL